MRRLLLRIAIIAASTATVACGLIIGLDEKPARPNNDAGNSAETGANDAGPTMYCDSIDAFFCDDFDWPDQKPKFRWPGYKQILPSPLVRGDASLQIILDAAGATSPPGYLWSRVAQVKPEDFKADSLLSVAFVESDAAPTPGVRPLHPLEPDQGVAMVLSFQLENFVDLRGDAWTPAVGPDAAIENAAKVPIASFDGLTPDGGIYGSVLGVGPEGFFLVEKADNTELDTLVRVSNDNPLGFQDVLVEVGIATGPREKVTQYVTDIAQRTPQCGKAEWVTVAWTFNPRDNPVCVSSPKKYHPVPNGQPFGIALGLITNDPSAASARFDNVRVDIIP